MIVLAIDTASTLCAACVWDSDASRERGRCVEDIGKGHAERLMDVINSAMASAGVTYRDLEGIAVSVGPGSFTGIRVGVSAARGLALALQRPTWGITTLAALAEDARAAFPGRPVLAAIDARRDELYVEGHDPDGALTLGPVAVPYSDAGGLVDDPRTVLTGSGAAIIAAASSQPLSVHPAGATGDIATFARLAALGRVQSTPPRPLYLRAPDARPQDGFALPRKAG